MSLQRTCRRASVGLKMLAVCALTCALFACNSAPAAEKDTAINVARDSEPVQAKPVPQKQFPPQDHLNKIVASYNVANEYPELLTELPCYCPCELYGHGGVIDCHRSQTPRCAIFAWTRRSRLARYTSSNFPLVPATSHRPRGK